MEGPGGRGPDGDFRLHFGRQLERRACSHGGDPELGGTASGTSETLPLGQGRGHAGAGGPAQIYRYLCRNCSGGNGTARASCSTDMTLTAVANRTTAAP